MNRVREAGEAGQRWRNECVAVVLISLIAEVVKEARPRGMRAIGRF